MKIAYILNEFPSVSETFILREILALQRKGADITVYALKASCLLIDQPEVEVLYRPALFSLNFFCAMLFFLRRHPMRLFCIFSSVFRHWYSPILMLKIVRNLPAVLYFAHEAALCDTTHVHAHFAFIPADIAGIMSNLLRLPYSVSVHAWDIYAQNRTTIKKRLERATFTAVCTNKGYLHLASLLPEIQNKLYLVYHGLVPDDFSFITPTGSQILAVGRLVEKKGFDVLINACSILKSREYKFTCIVVGDGPQRKRLENIIINCELDKHVAFAGEVTGKQLTDVFRQSAVLVMPSVQTASGDVDGLTNVILEGMAMGLPVVTTDAASANEAVTNCESGFIVSANDPLALADKIEILLNNSSKAVSMGRCGREIIQDKFDIDRNIKALIRLFH